MTSTKAKWFVAASSVIGVALTMVWWVFLGACFKSLAVQGRDAGQAGHAVDPALPVVSRASCKPAWRQSLTAVTTLAPNVNPAVRQSYESARETIQDALAIPDDAWQSEKAQRLLQHAVIACAPDSAGAWAISIRVASGDAGPIAVELQRLNKEGNQTSKPSDLDQSPFSSFALTTVPDMNQDGVPEALAKDYSFQMLFTAAGGVVRRYPGTDDFMMAGVEDVDKDGRPEFLYHYLLEDIHDDGCGRPTGRRRYSPPLVAFAGERGVLRFDDARARAFARDVCPGPPDSPEQDALCTLLWGAEKRAFPDYTNVRRACVARYAKADRKAERQRQGAEYYNDCLRDAPSLTHCAHFDAWQKLLDAKFPVKLWPPAEGESVFRSEQENARFGASARALQRGRAAAAENNLTDAIAAYREALANSDEPDVIDAEIRGDVEGRSKAGRKNSCPVRIVTDEVGPPSLEEWKKSAGPHRDIDETDTIYFPKGDYYEDQNDSDYDAFRAYRYPLEKRDAYYKMNPGSGRVVRCLAEHGCECTALSPCVRGLRPLPPAMVEISFFSKKTSRRVLRATWPSDAVDSDDPIYVTQRPGRAILRGPGCKREVKLQP